jgi:hypothetical protein
MLLVVTGLVLVYAKWWAWYGGSSWGPCFFVFATVPASLLLAVRLHHVRDAAWRNALTVLVAHERGPRFGALQKRRAARSAYTSFWLRHFW